MIRADETFKKAAGDYLLWMIENGYAESTCRRYEAMLSHFCRFITRANIPWDAVFSDRTLSAFTKEIGPIYTLAAVRGLSRYLFDRGQISCPIQKTRPKLPDIYENYLAAYATSRQVHRLQLLRSANTLSALKNYLEREKISLAGMRIEHIDAFLAERNANYSPEAGQNQRSNVRGFLRYLYRKRILRRDLAPLVVGAPLFAQARPPRFLRPHEVKRLFETAGKDLPRAKALRSVAMLYLAYTLGLRPIEISRIRLDDIAFAAEEIRLPDRKSNNPVRLPLSEDTLRAIAAYLIGARPSSGHRRLFLILKAPYGPITPVSISVDIKRCMRKANLSASAYCLRHTYAQSLLEKGATLFEIKEMMGHDSIETTRRYLHIHTRLMREVLFDETL